MNLQFIGRDSWGAKHAAGFGARPIPCAEAWLHHTVTLAPDLAFSDLNADSLDDDEAKAMRQLEAIGQSKFGGGFSYNLAVMPSGRVYVGCGVRRIGAHTAKRNTRALGVCLVGDYSTRTPPQPMQDALVGLLRMAKAEGWLPVPRFTGGHRDAPGAQTACPGNAAHRLLATLNDRASRPEPTGTTPTPPPAKVTTPPAPPAAPTLEGPHVIIVLAPDDSRQFVCDITTAAHITPGERAVLVAGGVGYAGPEVPKEHRREFLVKRGVTL